MGLPKRRPFFFAQWTLRAMAAIHNSDLDYAVA
jgi:hypothetical protein